MTPTTIATNAAISSTNNSQRQKETCKFIVENFDPQGNIKSKQEYAACVQKLYLNQMPEGQVMAIKISISIILIAIVFGFVRALFSRKGLEEILFTTFMHGFMAFCAVFAGWILIGAVSFLLFA